MLLFSLFQDNSLYLDTERFVLDICANISTYNTNSLEIKILKKSVLPKFELFALIIQSYWTLILSPFLMLFSALKKFQLLFSNNKSYASNDSFNAVVFFSFLLPLLVFLIKDWRFTSEGSIYEVINTLSPLIKSKASKNFDIVFSVYGHIFKKILL